jgi:hypothetical protein
VKKFYSISLAFLILLAGMHLTFAVHYCGGIIAASKISVSGKLASCGMEGIENTCPLPGDRLNLKTHCCDDEISIYQINNTYTPSFSNITHITQNVLQIFSLPVNDTFQSFFPKNTLLTSVSPPGKFFTSAVSLIDICVFRN